MGTLLILFLTCLGCFAAPAFVNSTANIEFKNSYLWNDGINFQPGDGETVTLNPPKFGWFYATNMPWSPEVQDVSTFVLQVSTNSNFSDYIVNQATDFNFYNFLAPMPTGVNIYWKVVYKNLAGSTIFTSAVKSFVISPSATTWDRSMLASSSYRNSKATHPYMLFNSSNKAALSNFVADVYANRDNTAYPDWKRQAGKQHFYTKFYADTAIAATWMTNYVTTNLLIDFTTRAQSLGDVAFLWHMTGDAAYTNKDPMKQLYYTADYFIKADLWNQDPVAVQSTFAIEHVALAYDMLYDYLAATQITRIKQAISLYCGYSYYGAWRNRTWRNALDPTAWEAAALAGTNYTGGYFITQDSPGHLGTSHWHDQHYTAFRAGMGIFNEDTWGQLAMELGLNYLISRGSPFANDAGVNQGRSYGQGGFGSVVDATIRAQIIFPEAMLMSSPIIQSNVYWWDYMIPVGYLPGNEAWGDGDYGITSEWIRSDWGRSLALISSNGIAWKHYTNTIGSFITNDSYAQQNHEATYKYVPIPYHFPPPATAVNNNTGMIFPADGWAFMSGSTPTDFIGYTNDVGLIFCARPRGSEQGHSHNSELSFQIWAYGANVTDAGGAYGSAISKVPEGHYSLLVNGFGAVQGEFSHGLSYSSKITAYTNSSDLFYVSAQAVQAYPSVINFPVSDAFHTEPYKTQLQSTRNLTNLTSLSRQILSPRKKYFVIRDNILTSNSSTSSWVYHVLQNTLTLDTNNKTFNYTATNTVHGSNVTTYVVHLTRTNGMTVYNQTGANVSRNPVTGTNFASGVFPRSNTLWFNSTTPATSHTYTTVIYPVKWGVSAPTITRIDDDTVRVISGAEDDIVSFNSSTATANGATIIVDTSLSPASGPQLRPNARIITNTRLTQ